MHFILQYTNTQIQSEKIVLNVLIAFFQDKG